jgi:hypothetical protein
MDTTVETVEIELEDVGGTSWWAGILTTLVSQYGNAQMRFVARPPTGRPYTGATFPVPRTLGSVDPEEAWAPGMTRSLAELCDELERDGWVRQGVGRHAWSIVYARVVPAAASRGTAHDAPAARRLPR